MSTRWQIAARLSDGTAGCIYVHCDGYPEHALNVLHQHYTDQAKIDALIAGGDCLGVHPELTKCDRFFGRAGELWEDVRPTIGADLLEVAEAHKHGDEEYRYCWDGSCWAMAKD